MALHEDKNKLILAALGVAAVAVGSYFVFQAFYGDNHHDKPSKETTGSVHRSKSEKHIRSNVELVDYLKHMKMISPENKEVADAMRRVDRAKYLPSDAINPYEDDAKPIGFNATCSSPHMHALGLDLLYPAVQMAVKEKGHANVLDVGSGSGYITACLALLVGELGRVYAIEHFAELIKKAEDNITKDNPQCLTKIHFKCGDGFQGWEENAPYDAIYVGAAAESVPDALKEQLAIGGTMVIPVGPAEGFHNLLVIKKNLIVDVSKGPDIQSITQYDVKNLGVVRFTPLTTKELQTLDATGGARTKVHSFDGKPVYVMTSFSPAPDSSAAEIKEIARKLNNQHT